MQKQWSWHLRQQWPITSIKFIFPIICLLYMLKSSSLYLRTSSLSPIILLGYKFPWLLVLFWAQFNVFIITFMWVICGEATCRNASPWMYQPILQFRLEWDNSLQPSCCGHLTTANLLWPSHCVAISSWLTHHGITRHSQLAMWQLATGQFFAG